MKYLKIFVDFAIDIERLNDAEVGRLFRAMLSYASNGICPELKGNEQFLWGTARKNIDNQKEKYESQCEVNKRIATNRYESLRTSTKKNESLQDKEKEKDKEKIKEKSIEKKSLPPFLDTDFSTDMANAIKRWLEYKKERKETYKPTGLQALCSQIKNKIAVYGESDIIALIDECMANGWRGIIWDRLNKMPKPKKQTYNLDKFAEISSHMLDSYLEDGA